MCDSICNKNRKVLIPAPYFAPPVVEAYPCTTVEVDTPIYEPVVKPIIKNIVQETTINIPKVQYREKIVEIPKVEYRQVPNVKYVETPVFQDRYKYKDVEVPQKQFKVKPIYKVVEIPEIEYVDKFVEKKYKRFKYVPKEIPVPFKPKREIYTEIPVPNYIPQTIDDAIMNNNMNQNIDQNIPMIIPPTKFNEIPIQNAYGNIHQNINVNPYPMTNTFMMRKENSNKCCLSNLCGGNNDKANIEFIETNPIYMNQYDNIGYSPPFIIQEEESNLCNCLIETTSNILAASGIAIILAGKLTIDGINYIIKKSTAKDTTTKERLQKYKTRSSMLTDDRNKSYEASAHANSISESLKSSDSSLKSDTIDLN